MNSVFKFYNQVWTLLALAAAVMMSAMLRAAFTNSAPLPAAERMSDGLDEASETGPPETHEHGRRDWSIRGWGMAGSVVAAAMIVCGLLYPVFATLPRLDQRFDGHPNFNTLNGLDWMTYGTLPGYGNTIAFADDRKAIDWFNEDVKGSPVIAEASIGAYRGNGSRFSIATGLPDVIGWDHHETQQRYPDGIIERVQDMHTLYDSTDLNEKRAVLLKYGVRYVILGDVERYTNYGGQPYASPAGLAAIDQMVGSTLEVAFRSGTTTVYLVK